MTMKVSENESQTENVEALGSNLYILPDMGKQMFFF